jgi:hypothetical protein
MPWEGLEIEVLTKAVEVVTKRLNAVEGGFEAFDRRASDSLRCLFDSLWWVCWCLFAVEESCAFFYCSNGSRQVVESVFDVTYNLGKSA